MVIIRESAVDTPEAHALLAEYFHYREAGFARENVLYTITFPDPAAFIAPQGMFVIAYDPSDRAVGCAGIRRLADGGNDIRFELKHLYLRPETRGKGWGRALLEFLEDSARKYGAGEMVLDTHHSLTAAGSLYANAGYTLIERYNENPNATRWFAKPLTL
ncbi:GNAT family N-acetyltransferase (plasmid) [Coraliomargarita sp. W4R53]